MLTTLRPAAAARSARSLCTTAARASQSFYTRDPIPPPVQYDPSYNANREAAHAWFDKEGYRAEGRIEWPVQWGDSDMFQHTNNVAYVRYLESARVRFALTLAPELGQETADNWMYGRGMGWILKEQTIRYRLPVTYPDSLIWAPKITALNQAKGSFTLSHAAWSVKHNAVAVTADSYAVMYDFDNLKKGVMSDHIREVLEKGAAPASPATALPTRTPSSFLSKGKEGLRKVSDKLKEKQEKDREAKAKAAAAAAAASTAAADTYTESLQAFLRIRPPPADTDPSTHQQPYLEPQGDKEVLMRAPPDPARPHLPKPNQVYSFDRVFKPETAQAEFFQETTLPLVDKLLRGENGLMFSYGVSNSGKTYTIQGGDENGLKDRGTLPRAMDVVFNSIKGIESNVNLKCQGLADVVLTDEDDGYNLSNMVTGIEPRIEDSVKVDRNFSYAVFVSYAEVYNEKIFDLLDSVLPSSRPTVARTVSSMRFSNYGLSGAIGSSMSLAAMANGGGGVLKRRALVLKNDPEGSGKYIAGLHEIRVRTRDEALAVFRTGQRARQVFGTMANRESSRSHGIFTLKVVRIHNGAPEDPDSAQVSRLSIVDLAGSERTRNTHNTGDRLKEAGNINKSLMVLGQCLEVLRANQQKVAAPAPPGLKKKLAVVPFRHSKLTEIFQNFFVGDGRAVMVVHVNPYDTGFDENSHVMRFSAVAREIQTTANLTKTTTSLKRQISTQFNAVKHAFGGGQKIKVVVPVMRPPSTTPYARQSTMPPPPVPPKAASRSVRPPTPAQPEPEPEVEEFVEEEIEVVEEDAEEEEDDDEKDALVDYLFEQLADLKTQLYESEMRNATLEVEIREEVSHEVQETIQRMQAEFQRRIQLQAISGEEKADMKLDILQRTMGHVQSDVDTSFDQSFASADETLDSDSGDTTRLSDPFAMEAPRGESDDESELEIDESLVMSEAADEDEDPLAESVAHNSVVHVDEVDPVVHVGEVDSVVPSAAQSDVEDVDDEEEDDEEDDDTEGEDDSEELEEDDESEELEEDSEDDSEEEEEEEEEMGDSSFAASSVSSAPSSPQPARRRATQSPSKKLATPRKSAAPRLSKFTPASTPLGESLRQLRLGEDDDEDDVAPLVKSVKKKRTLGKRVATEDEIEAAAERNLGGAEVRRMVRN
ncbi:Kinesin-like protein KIF23 [Vanrija pseudolonga]|uniref:Kinesin-like protein KIF23 n=1 Tax=Vanrija pseudolonga TaxID=143232 RepID=A0AAF1BMV2_9TREE|nr:Kinesin-like protein KIF23 [Vanrija pseudolonga]